MADATELLQALSKVVGSVTVDGKSAAKLATNLVPATPRRRAAVVLHEGFAGLDLYQRVRPKVFVGSLVVAVGATGMAWWRRRNGAEAVGSWGMLAAVAGLAAYLTRPGAGTGNPQAVAGPTAQDRVYGWLDARAQVLDRMRPGWEEEALRRVVG
jgi:hypothetical protein